MEEKEIDYLKSAVDNDNADISEEEMDEQLSIVDADPNDYEDEYEYEDEDEDEREAISYSIWEIFSNCLNDFQNTITPQITNNFESYSEIKKSIVWDALGNLENLLHNIKETTSCYEIR